MTNHSEGQFARSGDMLLRELPVIRRARDYHLYDLKGRRYIDLYQGGGTALLGHRVSAVSTVVKNVISEGLHADLPSVYEHRLVKAIQELVPTHPHVRLFATRGRALEQAAIHRGHESCVPVDPAVADAESGGCAYWRPLLDLDWSVVEVLVPVVPYPGPARLWPVCFRSAVAPGVAESDLVSPPVLAGMAKSVWEYRKRRDSFAANRWQMADGPGWERRGPYLRYAWAAGEHERLWRAALERGVLLSPYFPGPSILPPDLFGAEVRAIREVSLLGDPNGT